MTDTIMTMPALPGDWQPTRWMPPTYRKLAYEEIEYVFEELRQDRNHKEQELSTRLWWLADAINYGEAVLGEQFFQMVDEKNYSKESLVKVRRMGEEFSPEDRWHPAQVSFWTHWEVTPLAARSDRRRLLREYAKDAGMSREDLRDEVRALLKVVDDGQEELDVGDVSGDESDLPTCPLCSGTGLVTKDRREAYLREEGVVSIG